LYEVWLQPNVEKKFTRLRRRDRARWTRIRKRLDDLEKDPRHGAIDLKDPSFHGLKRVRAGKDRISYQICEECGIDLKIHELRNCIDCENMSQNTIKIFDIDDRDSIYSKHV